VHDMWWKSLPAAEYSNKAMVQAASGRTYIDR
jgi:hypothetical protein